MTTQLQPCDFYANSSGEYTGEIANGLAHGNGEIQFKSSDSSLLFTGIFENGYPKSGKWLNKNIEITVEYNHTENKAQIINNKILVYSGQTKYYYYHGNGTLYNKYGKTLYNGEFKLGKYDGTGTLYNSKGQLLYEGQFKLGKYDGEGILYNSKGQIYQSGTFKKGILEGTHCKEYKNGKLFKVGKFVNGNLEGEGIILNPNGFKKDEGNFSKGALHGKGIRYDGYNFIKSDYFIYGVISGTFIHYGQFGRILRTGTMLDGKFMGYKFYYGHGSSYESKVAISDENGNFINHGFVFNNPQSKYYKYEYKDYGTYSKEFSYEPISSPIYEETPK